MDTILIIALGLCIGFCSRRSLLPRVAEYASIVLVCGLVFLLGRELGSGVDGSTFGAIAFNAVLLTAGSIVGSVAAATIVERYLTKK